MTNSQNMIRSVSRKSQLPLISKIAFMVLVLTSSSVNANAIYTWIDDNGVTHYSQQPPASNQASSKKLYSEDIEPKHVGTIAPTKSVADLNQPSELEQQAAAIALADKQQAQQVCKNAQHSLNVLTTHTKLTKKNSTTGELVSMTEEQRQAEIVEQNQKIKLFCKT
ncbi:hypothetical protein TUM4438_32900 [Shewanella sairae]|uniref:DUF4124 domain-containing protein n=1 Tax=Shewanella sairae TaxID=190310 RepID=A0ABQ4PMD0_9GAMM|nr:DUF4124 domain-containing protein [Shewanella sairae]MCL1131932.1 DUF4124 domain-containing protein [Shewanella sairae]GIU49389.1 hypothetical protein TUM4438_32900 [Shewanella sairae]